MASRRRSWLSGLRGKPEVVAKESVSSDNVHVTDPERQQGLLGHTPTHEQGDCFFLTKLPLELRHRIYSLVIGQKKLYLMFPHTCQRSDRFRHRSTRRRLHQLSVPVGERKASDQEPQSSGWSEIFDEMSLMLTCHQIHLEALEWLYYAADFSFDMLMATLLPSSILSFGGLNSVRRLHCDWELKTAPIPPESGIQANPNNGHQIWCSVWQILASMKTLRFLEVYLDIPVHWQGNWILHEHQILSPLKQVQGLESFNLVLPFPSITELVGIGEESIIEDLPCRIERTHNPKIYVRQYSGLDPFGSPERPASQEHSTEAEGLNS